MMGTAVFAAKAEGLVGRLNFSQYIYDMAQEKQERVQKYRFDEQIDLCVTAHRLVCFALKSVSGISPAKEDWALEERGKPYLKSGDVHFSISHSGTYAVCAVHDKPVGIDVERMGEDNARVARRFMSDEEFFAYEQSADRRLFFYQVWTLKESYLKYKGVGIGCTLNRVTIYPSGEQIVRNVQDCTFSVINQIPLCQCALCTQGRFEGDVQWVGADQLFS